MSDERNTWRLPSILLLGCDLIERDKKFDTCYARVANVRFLPKETHSLMPRHDGVVAGRYVGELKLTGLVSSRAPLIGSDEDDCPHIWVQMAIHEDDTGVLKFQAAALSLRIVT